MTNYYFNSLINQLIIVISGPSGVGKGLLISKILNLDSKLSFSVSATTRTKRINEEDKKDYFFISKKTFTEKINNDEFLEWELVHNNYYGTLKYYVKQLIEDDLDVLLDLDTKGAQKIKTMIPDSVLIFIYPPSINELKNRLKKRGTDSEEEITRRLLQAKIELSNAVNYDYLVLNNDVDETAFNVMCIINAERCKTSRAKGEFLI